MQDSYTLTLIEDVETPLAGTIETQGHLFVPAMMGSIIVLFGIIGLIYFLECNKYQKRYRMLMCSQGREPDKKRCWNIKQLKELILEEETEAVDALDEDAFTLS